eukprot:TRINITY_DN1859_c0_g1_i2.p1 TRINITY_DN1859_c0_g1~~TRINITY_DN1859_c0_g1_i2.p1  ORF type:complete len:597 (-),score=160.47 TRINITY_DN1859_c0_g1_i2:587-2377(-)
MAELASKAAGAASEIDRMAQFPVGLRVLVVDDDPLCLMILERMLRRCSYTVTTCGRATTALALLREKKGQFDLVISDVYMPDMDGFKLLELVGLEMDLPVVMMSANGETSTVMKGITHGACDYLLKPIRIEELHNIWQHVVRRRSSAAQLRISSSQGPGGEEQTGSVEDGELQRKKREDEVTSSGDVGAAKAKEEGAGKEGDTAGQGSGSVGGGNLQPSEQQAQQQGKKRKEKSAEEELLADEEEQEDPITGMKRARVVWSVELHQQFVNAVNELGVENAVPKRILELMNVQGLTRENVASHLQKYRLYLKRLSGSATGAVGNTWGDISSSVGGASGSGTAGLDKQPGAAKGGQGGPSSSLALQSQVAALMQGQARQQQVGQGVSSSSTSLGGPDAAAIDPTVMMHITHLQNMRYQQQRQQQLALEQQLQGSAPSAGIRHQPLSAGGGQALMAGQAAIIQGLQQGSFDLDRLAEAQHQLASLRRQGGVGAELSSTLLQWGGLDRPFGTPPVTGEGPGTVWGAANLPMQGGTVSDALGLDKVGNHALLVQLLAEQQQQQQQRQEQYQRRQLCALYQRVVLPSSCVRIPAAPPSVRVI